MIIEYKMRIEYLLKKVLRSRKEDIEHHKFKKVYL